MTIKSVKQCRLLVPPSFISHVILIWCPGILLTGVLGRGKFSLVPSHMDGPTVIKGRKFLVEAGLTGNTETGSGGCQDTVYKLSFEAGLETQWH